MRDHLSAAAGLEPDLQCAKVLRRPRMISHAPRAPDVSGASCATSMALPNWTPFAVESRIEQKAACRPGRLHPQFPAARRRPDPRAAAGAVGLRLSMSYAILESPMPVENYIATLSLTPVTDGNRTFAEWQAEFDCAPEREARWSSRSAAGVFPGGAHRAQQRFPAERRWSRSARAPSSTRRSMRSGGPARFQRP